MDVQPRNDGVSAIDRVFASEPGFAEARAEAAEEIAAEQREYDAATLDQVRADIQVGRDQLEMGWDDHAG